MKRFFLTLILLSSVLGVRAQSVTFVVSDGLSNAALKERIAHNLSVLLAGFNDAYDAGTVPDLSGVSISSDAKVETARALIEAFSIGKSSGFVETGFSSSFETTTSKFTPIRFKISLRRGEPLARINFSTFIFSYSSPCYPHSA